jgi:hypothetical protein
LRNSAARSRQEVDALLSQTESEESFYDQAPAVSKSLQPQRIDARKENKKALASPRGDSIAVPSSVAPEVVDQEMHRERAELSADMPAISRAMEESPAPMMKAAPPESGLALFNRPLAPVTDTKAAADEPVKRDVVAKNITLDRYYKDKSSAAKSVTGERILRKISLFRAQGRFQQADKLLKLFHQRYPDYPAAQRERILDSVAPLNSHPQAH